MTEPMRIDRRISWGQIGSTAVVLFSGFVAVITIVWYLSALFTNTTRQLIDLTQGQVMATKQLLDLTMGQGQLQKSFDEAKTAFEGLQTRFAALEKAQLAYPPSDKIALLTQVSALADAVDALKKQLLASDDATRAQIADVTQLQRQARDKQQAIYQDLNGFKCKIVPKDCKPAPGPQE